MVNDMNIYYTDNTLYVNLNQRIDDYNIYMLKKRVFNILDDYDIQNIVLNIVTSNKNNILLDEFIKEYNRKYHGNIMIR